MEAPDGEGEAVWPVRPGDVTQWPRRAGDMCKKPDSWTRWNPTSVSFQKSWPSAAAQGAESAGSLEALLGG